jgi:hypothetical protein
MIDHGFVLDGPNWTFMDSPLQGLYYRPVVYENVRSLDDFEPWLTRVVNFPEEVVDQAYKQIPREWLSEGDDQQLENLLEKLLARRKRVPYLIEDVAANARNKPFPLWKS